MVSVVGHLWAHLWDLSTHRGTFLCPGKERLSHFSLCKSRAASMEN